MKNFCFITLLFFIVAKTNGQENKWLYPENLNLFFSSSELNPNWLNANLIFTKNGCNITLFGKNYQDAKTSTLHTPKKLDGGHMGAMFTIGNKDYAAIIYTVLNSRFLIIAESNDSLSLSTPIVLREIVHSREYVANKYEEKQTEQTDENSAAFLQGLMSVLKLVF